MHHGTAGGLMPAAANPVSVPMRKQHNGVVLPIGRWPASRCELL
jgi:hypothetical protein